MDDELVGEDPILAIRLAVSRVLRVYGINQDHKRFVDAVAAALPDFFRQPLQPISEHTSQSTKADIVGRDVDQTYGAGVSIELKPGMAWALYCDDGPGGPCGQSMRTTCPHSVLMTWPNETAMREAMDGKPWRNKKHRIMWGVVDEYTVGGIFRVVQSG